MDSKENLKKEIELYNVKPKHSKGQNFLNNDLIVEKIVDECLDDEYVLEIGPGTGVMTEKLSKKFEKVLAIELDDDLIPILNSKFEKNNNVTILHNDALKVNYDEIIQKYFGKKICVCANIPYNISTPLVEKLLFESRMINKIVIMVQKEFGEKLLSINNSKECVPLSYLAEYKAISKKCFLVSPSNFIPPPKVTSIVIRMNLKDNNKTPFVNNEMYLYKLIKTAFNQRRKKITNSLSTMIDKNVLVNTLEKLKIDGSLRGEDLTLNDYCMLANCLYE